MMAKTTEPGSLIPYAVITSAVSGDIDAINAVLQHYGGYITKLSTRRRSDESGKSHLCVDDGIKCRLETKLITAIMNFDLT